MRKSKVQQERCRPFLRVLSVDFLRDERFRAACVSSVFIQSMIHSRKVGYDSSVFGCLRLSFCVLS